MWPNMFSVELYRSRCVTLCLFMCRWVVCFWILDPKGQDKWLLWGNHVRSGQSSSMVQSPNITTARCSIIKVNFHCKIKAKKKNREREKSSLFVKKNWIVITITINSLSITKLEKILINLKKELMNSKKYNY